MSAEIEAFILEVEGVLAETADEHEITKRVAERLAVLLTSDYRLPEELTRPSEEHHVNYPLYIAPDDKWSLAVVVWNLGQRTPVHGHETWGVVGIYEGAERETRYVKPADDEVGVSLKPLEEQVFERGQVTVCCTTDDDVHSVAAAGDVPTVGIHVYGGNIGTIERRRYEPETGAVQWFVSGWNEPVSR
ncbi:hypothetical protein LFM09_26880 [Lentzea alba]|uniref:cysteine dioxygenase family protein n=1 Tax=Lentzea alba TaxID=2714351 RepID=UPI0039BF9C76